ncbi:hypothetical protein thalar_02331 [Litoreibacter arenae DSM 19593]|uniref:Uncharacterized protein n=1 Tax=Litoreibacter arenae DSM 19593 TaxID=1123360 RepID=S9RX16_9RHOB|nr:hypothetical protein thalar_02331 [Litoreibacter arenae DSM 19593]
MKQKINLFRADIYGAITSEPDLKKSFERLKALNGAHFKA